jgi:DNA-binding NtrC family response regulator
VNKTFKVLVWDDDSLQWIVNITRRLRIFRGNWAQKFTYKDSKNIFTLANPNLQGGRQLLKDFLHDKPELTIEFIIYNSRGIETENFHNYPLFLTDIKMGKEHHSENKRHLGEDCQPLPAEKKERYGFKTLGKMAAEQNPDIFILAASQFIHDAKERMELLASLGGAALNIFDKNSLSLIDNNDDTAWTDCAVQLMVSAIERVSLKVKLEEKDYELEGYKQAELRALVEVKKKLIIPSGMFFFPEDYISCISNLKAALCSTAYLILYGESGVGKSTVAEIIHNSSTEDDAEFHYFDCGSFQDSFHSDLFGHEKGAFTDAHTQKKGIIEQAKGGTLFLDEIANLPLEIQTSLLSTLSKKTIRRIGASAPINVSDVRIIFATNKNLEKEVKAGKFNEDLYTRINILSINIPPLRDRPTNAVNKYAKHFLNKYNPTETIKFSDSAKELIENYHWPKNLHELEGAIQRGLATCFDGLIEAEDLGIDLSHHKTLTPPTKSNNWQCPVTHCQLSKEEVQQAKSRIEGKRDGKRAKITPASIYPHLPQDTAKERRKNRSCRNSALALILFYYALIYKVGDASEKQTANRAKIFATGTENWKTLKESIKRIAADQGAFDMDEYTHPRQKDLSEYGLNLLKWLEG